MHTQNSASVVNCLASAPPPPAACRSLAITPAFWYSPTRRSKKFVLPWIEIKSIQSNGLVVPYSGAYPSSPSMRSATNSMSGAAHGVVKCECGECVAHKLVKCECGEGARARRIRVHNQACGKTWSE